jgi:hypothetical protein
MNRNETAELCAYLEEIINDIKIQTREFEAQRNELQQKIELQYRRYERAKRQRDAMLKAREEKP